MDFGQCARLAKPQSKAPKIIRQQVQYEDLEEIRAEIFNLAKNEIYSLIANFDEVQQKYKRECAQTRRL